MATALSQTYVHTTQMLGKPSFYILNVLLLGKRDSPNSFFLNSNFIKDNYRSVTEYCTSKTVSGIISYMIFRIKCVLKSKQTEKNIASLPLPFFLSFEVLYCNFLFGSYIIYVVVLHFHSVPLGCNFNT